MKIKEIVEMSTDELLTKRRDLRQERLHLRLQQQSGQLEQPSRLRLLRRDVARIDTILSQRAKNHRPFQPQNQSRRRRTNLWPSKQHTIDPPPILYGAASNRRRNRRRCRRSTRAQRGRRGWAKLFPSG